MPDITKSLRYPGTAIQHGDSGIFPYRVKLRLFELGYFDEEVTGKKIEKIKSERFGSDSVAAAKAFQKANGLKDDGIVGPITWAALFNENAAARAETSSTTSSETTEAIEVPSHFTSDLQAELAEALEKVSDTRRALCLRALSYAIDPSHPGSYPRSLYIRGANLFNKDLTENVITASRIESGAASQPQYYDDGRKEFMLRAVSANPDITGADCSGGVVGLWRKQEVQASGFDANANTLYGRYCVETDDPQPGDLAWKDGHVGLYVGAGRIVEWAGGAYGCQLTKANDRRCYDYVAKKVSKMSAWQAYGDPTCY